MGLFDAVRNVISPTHQPIEHRNPNQGQGTQTPALKDSTQQNPQADPANLPANGNDNTGKDPIISQLDPFTDLWKTPTPDPTKPAPKDPLSEPLLTFDPAKFATEARKMNFTAGINPELVQKALGGDAQALMDVINHSTQNAFTAASQLSTSMVEGATKTNNSRLNPLLETKFKEFMLQQNRTNDPVMQHEAVAPMLDLAKRQLLAKHPEKTAAEIHQMAETYVADFAKVFQENRTRSTNRASGASTDPSDFSSWDS